MECQECSSLLLLELHSFKNLGVKNKRHTSHEGEKASLLDSSILFSSSPSVSSPFFPSLLFNLLSIYLTMSILFCFTFQQICFTCCQIWWVEFHWVCLHMPWTQNFCGSETWWNITFWREKKRKETEAWSFVLFISENAVKLFLISVHVIEIRLWLKPCILSKAEDHSHLWDID